MQKQSVESSSISAIGYDSFSSVLEVQFKNGRVYQYAQVPKRTHTSLMKSKSKGGFLARSIKDKYDYRQIEPGTRGQGPHMESVTDTVHVLTPAR